VKPVPDKVIARLSQYRRLLTDHMDQDQTHIYSHELAALAGVSSAQVRRDFMITGYSGSPNRGYEIDELVKCIADVLDDPDGHKLALVGVGNLGRAILDYFSGRRPHLTIVAAFDVNPDKIGWHIHGVPCYHMDEIDRVVRAQGITSAVVSVPADQAQKTADTLVAAGVRGILTFTPAPMRVPQNVYIEEVDITTSLEKVAYYASTNTAVKREVK